MTDAHAWDKEGRLDLSQDESLRRSLNIHFFPKYVSSVYFFGSHHFNYISICNILVVFLFTLHVSFD